MPRREGISVEADADVNWARLAPALAPLEGIYLANLVDLYL